METQIAKQVRALRRERGWNVRQLAKALTAAGAPTSFRSIEGWEQDIRSPRPEAMQALLGLGMKKVGP